MKYSIKASSLSKQDASISIKKSTIKFGTTQLTSEVLPNPAELFLSAFGACILKNVERFSTLLKFRYSSAFITVSGTRQEVPPKMDIIEYQLTIYSNDDTLNKDLLKKNIEKFGTIFNTVNASCSVIGVILVKKE
jgi:uncharacterized OsmC-like protein